jgi:hypothetical protein
MHRSCLYLLFYRFNNKQIPLHYCFYSEILLVEPKPEWETFVHNIQITDMTGGKVDDRLEDHVCTWSCSEFTVQMHVGKKITKNFFYQYSPEKTLVD